MSMATPPPFLTALLPSRYDETPPDRPHITLTYAQSLDGCIAGPDRAQLALSGPESLTMTHWLRTMHDAILVGIGTALNDNPQLNVRFLPTRPEPYSLPRPIVIDTHLRTPPSCALLANFQHSGGRRPWLVCSHVYSHEKQDRIIRLENAGARIIKVRPGPNGLELAAVLDTLLRLGIRTLMVEGGQRVLTSFLTHPGAVDTLLVTVAPTLVGPAGVRVLSGSPPAVPRVVHVASAQFGRDTVVACRVANEAVDADPA